MDATRDTAATNSQCIMWPGCCSWVCPRRAGPGWSWSCVVGRQGPSLPGTGQLDGFYGLPKMCNKGVGSKLMNLFWIHIEKDCSFLALIFEGLPWRCHWASLWPACSLRWQSSWVSVKLFLVVFHFQEKVIFSLLLIKSKTSLKFLNLEVELVVFCFSYFLFVC